MQAGTYWIGDFCYVMHPEWDEVCDQVIDDHGCREGQFTLRDGRQYAMYNTGCDGVHQDQQGREYMVDSGSIGCILAHDIHDPEAWRAGGHIVTFANPVASGRDNDSIWFSDGATRVEIAV